MKFLWYEEDTHVTDVRIFKSHDDHPHEHNIQCHIFFHVTNYIKTNDVITPGERSILAPVGFEFSPSRLSLLDGLFRFIQYSVLRSRASLFRRINDLVLVFKSLGLAKEITAKILSRFSFNTTTSCSNIIIAVNLDRIFTGYFVRTVECNHDASSSCNNHGENMNDDDDGDGEDMDHDDNNDVDLDHENDNHDDNNDVDLDHENDNHDDNNDDDLDQNDNHENDNDDDEYQYNNSFSGFGEDFFSEFKEYSEVTGLVDVKPREVLNFTDCCSICLEEYGSDFSGVAKAEHCSHMFHKDCIQHWLRKSSNCCPLCRSVFIRI